MFNEKQEKLRADDPVKIALTFVSSPFVYGGDSKQRTPNPDYHPVICLTEKGKFVDVEGRPIPLAKVPDYIRDQAQPPKAAKIQGRREMNLSEAMTDATTPADPSSRPARKPAAKRGKSKQ